MAFHIERLLETTVRIGATDLYLYPSQQPQVWVDGQMKKIETSLVTAAEISATAETICSERAWRDFEKSGHAEFEYNHEGKADFRVSFASENGAIAAVFSRV